METVGIDPENIAPSCASMHQVPGVAPTHPYWARTDDERRCERTAKIARLSLPDHPKAPAAGSVRAHSGTNRTSRCGTIEQ